MPMRPRPPVVTVAFVAAVIATRVAQIAVPGWYDALARDPAAPWWRMFTALIAYDDGWVQFLAIALGALALGVVAERRFGWALWVAILVAAGLLGQACGLVWQPSGAGSSVAVAGWLGAFAAWLAWPGTRMPPQARVGGIVIAVLGAALTCAHDIHGPPILLGLALGGASFALGVRANEAAMPRGDDHVR
jgi:membrane associated rhomboid family serine protease